uniref:Uncharacterized protein n=1 Tax=Glossina palpalis gambiensis TaxID=67801 RepID=A0A1B0BG15_9MUSC
MSQQKLRHHVHQKTISILTAGPTEQNRCKPDFFGGPGQILHGLSMFIGMIQLLIGTIPISWCPSTWLKSLAIPLAPLGFATILWKW